MPWDNSPAARRRSDATYKDPDYQRNRKIALARAAGRCERCGTRARRLQTDHVIPVSQGGTHHADNLQVLCSGPGSCHARKTAGDSHTGRSSSRKAADPPAQPRTYWG